MKWKLVIPDFLRAVEKDCRDILPRIPLLMTEHIRALRVLLDLQNGINKKIGEKIREFRLEKSLSQEELAFEADLHRAYIGQIERGEKNIGVQNLQKIAAALKIKISKLIE